MSEVGVVAIGRNEGERLRRCLDSLAGRGVSAVYVDSGSTDGSVSLARSRGVEIVELDMSEPFSAARARNAGFERLTRADPGVRLVQFLDGDCEVADGWLDRARDELDADPGVAVVCGRRREKYPEHSIYNRMADIEWAMPIRWESPDGPAEACGGDAMMRADTFREAGGFDPSLPAGEEPELCQRLHAKGWRVVRLGADMTWHDLDMRRLGQWARRQFRTGYGALDTVTRFGRGGTGPFRKVIRSARVWAVGWPLAVIVGGVLAGAIGGTAAGLAAAGVLALALPAQMARVARSIRPTADGPRTAIAYGVLTMLGKWPQVAGQALYLRDRATGRHARLIEYKAEGPRGADPAWRADLARYPARPWLKEQSIWAIAVYRFGQRVDRRKPGIGRRLRDRVYWLTFRVTETLTGISIPKSVRVGPGLRIWHFGNIFVHADAVIGANCTLRQGVTIGNRVDGGPVPVIEDDVELGAYAQVLGGVRVGRGAKVGAMSVVLRDVPPGAVAVGAPARIVGRAEDEPAPVPSLNGTSP